jgi:hypothetical protein
MPAGEQISGERLLGLGSAIGRGKKGKRRGEGGGFIDRVLMAINSREVSGDGE